MMRRGTSPSGVVIGLALCVILISSQVSEAQRRGRLLDTVLVSIGFGPSSAPDDELLGPSAAPAPAPGPSSQSEGRPSSLQVGFYKGQCKDKSVDVEQIIADFVKAEFKKDPTLLPAMLRMQFHDCFVRGCDASILINGNSTEKTAGANASVRGYEFIDALKAILEEKCPEMVSCADIIAVATKEFLKLGGGPDYPVQTGRRDGTVSDALIVDLPSPFMTVPEAVDAFGAKGFSAEELVILLGCHSVGITHCAFVESRLYANSGLFDPLMDSSLRQQLIPTCPQNSTTNNIVFLNQDPTNKNTVDNSFYKQLGRNRGILELDQELARHPATNGVVQRLALSPRLFYTKLASAMIKLQAVEVLTGTQGQIRKVCSAVN